MRTYEDTFSGQKIYPGKVRFAIPPATRPMSLFRRRAPDTAIAWPEDNATVQLQDRR